MHHVRHHHPRAFRAVALAALFGIVVSGCQKSDTGEDSGSGKRSSGYGYQDSGMGGSGLAGLLAGMGGGGGGTSIAGSGGSSGGMGTASGGNPLSAADMAAVQAMLAALDDDGKQEVYDILIAKVADCSFLQSSGGSLGAQAAQCKEGDPSGCAGMLLGLGGWYFDNLGGKIMSVMGADRSACAAVDLSNPSLLSARLTALREACTLKSVRACIVLFMLVVRLFLFSFIAGLI